MTGRLSQRDGFREDSPPDSFSQPSLRHHIDTTSQELLQVKDQRRVIEQASARLQVDEEIDVALRPCLAAGDRTKHADVAGAVLGGKLQDLLSLFPEKLVEVHGDRWPGAVGYRVSDTARFFLLSFSAACAAARRAIGTRYGEQLT